MIVATAIDFIDLPTKTIAKIDDFALLVGLAGYQGRSSRSLAHVPSPT